MTILDEVNKSILGNYKSKDLKGHQSIFISNLYEAYHLKIRQGDNTYSSDKNNIRKICKI